MLTPIFKVKNLFIVCVLFSFASAHAQDSTKAWNVTLGLNMSVVTTYKIVGTDTGFANTLTQSPILTLTHKSGLYASYAPMFVVGGIKPGLYMQALSTGISQYDKPDYSYDISYSHYFFSSQTSVPYSPLNNEVYASFTYKKPWLNPEFSAGVGFGTNTEESPAKNVSDIGISAGVSHSFNWDQGNVSFSAIPDISLNAGTNDYFSFLKSTKYIGRSISASKLIKKGKAALAAKKRKLSAGSTTTTSTSQSNTFDLTNIALGFESSVETGAFTIRPEFNLYLPVGASSGSGVSAYWQLAFAYRF